MTSSVGLPGRSLHLEIGDVLHAGARPSSSPQKLTSRERAAARKSSFPPLDAQPQLCGSPPLRTLREVLDRLSQLALPLPDSNGAADRRNSLR
ncbi:hypothetical protein ACQP2U_13145 [Nocardia sp. CA-084685]|uniref:hypothetical protein n=1 Tax=Nocardia sp. CA-084685 TaxID=3239970 RepID=UPI003D992F2B